MKSTTTIRLYTGVAPHNISGTAYRALRDDAEFPLVVFGGEGPPYEVVRDEGDVDAAGGVRFINAFEVPPDRDAEFLAAWDAARDALEACHGFLGRRMHRATEDAAYRFVNLGRWSSPLMVQRALRAPAVEEAMARIAFPGHPGIYLPLG